MDIATELGKVIDGEVLADDKSLSIYSHDDSIFEVLPEVVVKPKGLEDLQKLIDFVNIKKGEGRQISLTPRNSGSCMSGGSLNQHIIVDMGPHFSGVDDIDHLNHVSVGAGTLFRDIEKKADEKNLMFGAYTSSKDFCGIGGMLGNNASGEKSIRFGATTDNVNKMHVVLADGNEYTFGPLNRQQLEDKCQQQDHEGYLYRTIRGLLEDNKQLLKERRPNVRKNAAGYDLWRIWDSDRKVFNLAHLFVGSQGTLGITKGANIKLVHKPEHTKMLVIGIDDLHQLSKAIQVVLNHNPEGLEVYDKHTYELAEKFMPTDAKAAASAKGMEMVLIAQFGEPSLHRTEHVTNAALGDLVKNKIPAHQVTSDEEKEAHWNIRRASFHLLKDHAKKNMRAAPFLEDSVVNISHFSEYVAALQAILDDYKLIYTYHGHIGDGNLRLIPLMNFEDPDNPRLIMEIADRVYDLILAFDGTFSADHNDGLIKTPYLKRMYGDEVMDLFEKVKHTFDPQNIFNPGKKVGADMGYSEAHISRSNKIGEYSV